VNRSTDRILTTHVGSLVRPRDIIEGMKARSLGASYDSAGLAAAIERGVADVVRRQVEMGIDIPNDGEYARLGYTSYINERLSGLEPRDLEADEDVWRGMGVSAERQQFADFFRQYDQHYRFLWMLPEVSIAELANAPGNAARFRITAPIGYRAESVQRDIATLKSALVGFTVADAFITAVTPVGRKSDRGILDVYSNETAYLYALADALHEEYAAITDAGFIVQLDYAALNPGTQLLLVDNPNPSEEDFRRAREVGVEIVNHALRGIPEDRVRYHHCWGSMNSPHTYDTPLRELAPLLLKIHAQAFAIEAANPRHEHEWMVWRDIKLPEEKILIPGMVSHQTNVVEHPELISWRLQNFASVIGKENLIAGADCGFSQFWDSIRVHPSVQWAKLEALVEGARLASAALW
jgi:5-methyltetrahydropteroyltriglutamate--homocysteine methyltransferase